MKNNFTPTTPCAMFLFLKERKGKDCDKAQMAFDEIRELKRLRNFHLGITSLHGYNLRERYEARLEVERLDLVINAEQAYLRLLIDKILDNERYELALKN